MSAVIRRNGRRGEKKNEVIKVEKTRCGDGENYCSNSWILIWMTEMNGEWQDESDETRQDKMREPIRADPSQADPRQYERRGEERRIGYMRRGETRQDEKWRATIIEIRLRGYKSTIILIQIQGMKNAQNEAKQRRSKINTLIFNLIDTEEQISKWSKQEYIDNPPISESNMNNPKIGSVRVHGRVRKGRGHFISRSFKSKRNISTYTGNHKK